jgi:hypothetical protein
MSSIDQSFEYLWNHGQRLLDEKDLNSPSHGMYREWLGRYEGYTIEGMKSLASQGKIVLGGLKLTPEEVELMFNYIKFKRMFKN